MPSYVELKRIRDTELRLRTVAGLKRLRSALAQQVPTRTASDTLLLATWNLREFDSGKYGYRTDEAYFYIAEVVSRFDLVAIQEVREGLYGLQRLRRLLGPSWEYIVTDVTLGTSGNSERLAYLFDTRKVGFTGLAAELVLPESREPEPRVVQFARSPYVAGFRVGWAYLTLVTVHIYYGQSVKVDPRRLEEIASFGKTLAKSAAKFSGAPVYAPDGKPTRDNLLILGDFNIFNRNDVTLEALTSAGFVVPPELQNVPGSNVDKSKHYDQIAYYRSLQALKPQGRAGVFDVFEQVYRLEDEALYAAQRATRPGRSFKDWRTYQMSDHLPMWVEFGVDDADAYLDSVT